MKNMEENTYKYEKNIRKNSKSYFSKLLMKFA